MAISNAALAQTLDRTTQECVAAGIAGVSSAEADAQTVWIPTSTSEEPA